MSNKQALKRDGTMQVTAKEGIQYLKDEGKETLIRLQGLDGDEDKGESEKEKPSLNKGSTMIGTAKEGSEFVQSQGGVDEDAKTRKQQGEIEKISQEKNDDASSAKKPRLSKDTTIKATAAEAKELLGKEKVGDTRSQTKQIQQEEKASPVKRSGTMQLTAEEGKEWIERDKEDSASPVKRVGTMETTAKDGDEWVKRADATSNKK